MSEIIFNIDFEKLIEKLNDIEDEFASNFQNIILLQAIQILSW